jgi:hypothetical protein
MFMHGATVFISLVMCMARSKIDAHWAAFQPRNRAVKHQDVAAERVKRTCTVPCKQRMVTTRHAVTMPCTRHMHVRQPSHAHDTYDRDRVSAHCMATDTA